jgi:chemotaxis protein methyltransferase CheR
MSRSPLPDDAHLSAEDLQRLCEYLYRQTGMLFGETKRYYIERRVADRLEATGSPSFAIYFSMLRADPEERERLINAFTVNETYFYREEHQLACLSRSLLPDLITTRRPGDKIRIWSAPCSTGEEAYSIAIWLLENWRMVDAYNVEIIGSDIDTRVLEAAHHGLYGERALSRLPADVIEAYFEPSSPPSPPDHQGPSRVGELHPGQPRGRGQPGLTGGVRRHLLPQRADLFRRRVQAGGGAQSLRPPGAGRLSLPGPHRIHGRISDRFLVRRFEDAIVYQRPAGVA